MSDSLWADDSLWILARTTGVVSLILLTVVVALGVATYRGVPVAGLPRFAVTLVHRSASLLAVVFVAVHVLILLADPYAGLTLLSPVVPFTAARHPVWYGLGAAASDLLLAVVVSSLVRTRLPLRVWRGVHLAAYVCWPVALIHALGSGTDAATPWVLGIAALCVVTVLVSVAARLAPRRSGTAVCHALRES